MSLRLVTFLVVAVLAIAIKAEMPERALLQEGNCTEACEAGSRTDPNTLREIIGGGRNVCNCRCDEDRGNRVGIIFVLIKARCIECLRLLFSSSPPRCPINARDDDGNTALHIAAKCCRPAVVEELIEMGFAVNARNSDGHTPLCCAARQDDVNCCLVIRILLQAGAEPCVRCSDGETPCEGCVNETCCNVLAQDGACDCP